ncbi:Uncharacterized phage-associated protein [Pelagirhabdus alkalitolerans]|uniref:Uncharacterized phage-associated protein n=1 Tax=Pelagirhabdus alkalitolerans TaxID=1612202 RepID=A0A1G6H5C6_9BACI|nr:type II toxin-antitoxin system antitoxin SocA domain-containing protein [Pelagirhabdus alkalitolerans]SDB89490.1 Uncharacterized phage-associated protein [Pelagirhabdus alkalitolerans]
MADQKLADHILAIAHQHDVPLTNLHLQKIMFFTLGFYMQKIGDIDNLAEEISNANSFRRWKYGPVVEEVYFKYNIYGDTPILSQGEYSEDYSNLDDIIIKLLKVSPFKLVEVSHKIPSWKNYRNEVLRREYVPPYSLIEIYKDFVNE